MNKEIPTIVIGLGGIGSEIVSKVEMQMRQNVTKKGDSYKRDNVRFVIIDTDINSIREREESGYRGYSVHLSSNISVSQCLEHDECARNEWFPDNRQYYRKSIAEGAGQVRSISRLALQRAIRTGMLAPLYRAITDLFLHESNLDEQEMKIVMVSTIAGGTGSGTLLPLGMHIKDYLNSVYSGSGAKINAFLILPDILYDVISSKKERRNLDANSYAVVKEIDGLINGNSDSVHVALPNERDDEVKIFSECPFDFCFLFNKLTRRNMVYGNLEDYKEVVARCLYTQFLGTLAPEYFSKEDNVFSSSIRAVMEKKHYERFAGAGCSIIRYPYDEISEYLSLCWMTDIMKREWVKYDEKRQEIRRISIEKQERGEEVTFGLDKDDFLLAVEAVDKEEKLNNKKKKSCEEKLKLRCEKTDTGSFYGELEVYIRERIEQERGDLKERIRDGYAIIEEGKIKKIKELRLYLTEYQEFRIEIEKENEHIYEKLSGFIENEICHAHEGELRPYYLEYYLVNNNYEYESPNYIRYVLYRLEKDLEYIKESLEIGIKSQKDSYESKLEEEVIADKLHKGSIRSHMKELFDLYNEQFLLLENELKNHCIGELLRYLKKLSESYESFFREYDRILILVDQRKTEMEKRFGETVHRMEHWVYSGNEDLQEMLYQMKLSSQYDSVGGQISKWLYCLNVKEEKDSFKEQYNMIRKMWREQFDKNYSDRFDMNILKALEEESKKQKKTVPDYNHVNLRLQEARDSASILLAACRSRDVKTRKYCIYPPQILADANCDDIVKEFFLNGLAVADTCSLDVDEKKIVFFEIAYGFLPSDIDFFADCPGVCADYSDGSGAKAYKWIVEHFCSPNKDAEITPHIDRTWHREGILNVDWEVPPFTLGFVLRLYILYIKTIVGLKNNECGYEVKFKAILEREFWECYEMNEWELWMKWTETEQENQADLSDMWKESVEAENIKTMVHRIQVLIDFLCERCCHSRRGEEYLKKEMVKIFWTLLERASWITPETIEKCKKEWKS